MQFNRWKLKQRRDQVAMTLDILSRTSGVSVSTLWRMEKTGRAHQSTLIRVARALNVQVDYFMEGGEK
jgi:transcriptional regulator with XRE-family HTH domain